MKKRRNKRKYRCGLQIIIICLAALLCGCANSARENIQSTQPVNTLPQAEKTNIDSERYTQSPWFDSHPLDGDGVPYPSVAERLPEEPFVMQGEGLEEGQYASGSVRVNENLAYLNNESLLLSSQEPGTPLQMNVLDSFEANEDLNVFRFGLRKGMRWSDGTYVTAEDARFCLEDCWGQEAFIPKFAGVPTNRPGWLGTPNGQGDTVAEQRGVPQITVLDEYHFELTYPHPMPELAQVLAGRSDLLMPSEFLKALHPLYDRKNEAPRDAWSRLYNIAQRPNLIATVPVLGPWVPDIYSDEVDRAVRNPYYWKVDTAGRQLPYIDVVYTQSTQMQEEITLEDLDICLFDPNMYDYGTQVDDARTFAQGNRRILLAQYTMDSGYAGYGFGLGNQSEWWQAMVYNPTFRHALCKAVDPAPLITLVTAEYGSGFEQWTYDPKAANELLDELMPDKDTDGFRQWNEETPVLKIGYVAYTEDVEELNKPVADIYKAAFEAVGVKCKLVGLDGSQFINNRDEVADVIIFVFIPNQPDIASSLRLFSIIDDIGYECYQTNGESGRWALPEVNAIFEEIDAYIVAPDIPLDRKYAELLQELADNALCYPGVKDIPYPVVVTPRLGNVFNQRANIQCFFDNAEMWYLK